MKINDLKNSFDAISPTAEQKDKMLTEILNAEEKTMTKAFDFRRLLVTVASVAAMIAISVVAFNYGDFNITEENNMVVSQNEETVHNTIKEGSNIKKSVKKEDEVKSKKPVQVASAKSVTESKIESVENPTPMSRARIIDEPALEVENIDNSGIAVASETDEQHNHGIAVVSEEDASNELEWMTVPAMEETEKLEEENVKTEEEETEEENEEETTEVTE